VILDESLPPFLADPVALDAEFGPGGIDHGAGADTEAVGDLVDRLLGCARQTWPI
jgi:hypothetical protein